MLRDKELPFNPVALITLETLQENARSLANVNRLCFLSVFPCQNFLSLYWALNEKEARRTRCLPESSRSLEFFFPGGY